MLRLILFVSCVGFSAWRITDLVAARQPEPLSRCDRGIWIAVFSLALWLGQGWTLAVMGRFNSSALLATSILVLAVILTVTRNHRPWTSRSWRWAPGVVPWQPIPFEALLPLAARGESR
jgi:hypothetical protein